MSEVVSDEEGICTLIGQREPAGVTQHVWMHFNGKMRPTTILADQVADRATANSFFPNRSRTSEDHLIRAPCQPSSERVNLIRLQRVSGAETVLQVVNGELPGL